MRFIPIRRHLVGSAAVSIVLLAACDSTPTQPETNAVVSRSDPAANISGDFDQYFNDLTDRSVSLGCEDGSASENVVLRGGIIERFRYVQLPTGTVVTRHESWPEGLWGIGLETGQEYDVTFLVQAHDSYADRGIMGHSREVWELRNRTTKALYHLTYAVRYVMDEDRNLVVHRWRERVACR